VRRTAVRRYRLLAESLGHRLESRTKGRTRGRRDRDVESLLPGEGSDPTGASDDVVDVDAESRREKRRYVGIHQ